MEQQLTPDQARKIEIEQARDFKKLLDDRYEVIRALRPLKIGIHKDLIALNPDVPPEVVKRAVK